MDLASLVSSLTGADAVRELTGGHQARVAVARGGALAAPLAVKVLDAGPVDPEEVATRVAVVEQLADREPLVCGPQRLDGRLVTATHLDDRPVLVTAWEWADGRPLDPEVPDDSERMGRTLAALHASMRQVDATPLPPVAALRAAPLPPGLGLDDQLLHGDVGHGNLHVGPGGVRVFDLDDCGRGPALFDVANAVYMARFAAWRDGGSGGFEEPFVAGYAAGTGEPVDADLLEALVALRIAALRTWLDDLTTAPIGIRTADPSWHEVLRRFAG